MNLFELILTVLIGALLFEWTMNALRTRQINRIKKSIEDYDRRESELTERIESSDIDDLVRDANERLRERRLRGRHRK